MFGVVGEYGCRYFCGFGERVLDDELDDGNRGRLDLVGQLFFDEIELNGLGAIAGLAFFLVLATATGMLLGRGAMAKDGEVGGEGHQQNQTYESGFKHCSLMFSSCLRRL